MRKPVSLIALVLLFLSCQSTDLVDADKPQINYVSFAGFPVTKMQFDKALRTITLQIPSFLPEEGLVPSFGLSNNAEIVQGLTPSGKLDLSLIKLCDNPQATNREVEVVVANETGTNTTSYRVILVAPKGCPAIHDRRFMYDFAYDENKGEMVFRLLLENAYQNFQIRSTQFTVLRNGGVRTTYEPANPCVIRYDGDRPNQIITTFGKDILDRGKYELWNQISITTDCDPNPISFYYFP